MKTLPGTLLASKLELCSHSATLVIISLGCLGLAGWMFELKSLRSVFHGFPAMVPNTAVAFVLAGCSLWLLRAKRPTRAGRWAAHACGLAVTLIGLLTVAEYILT